ncbi:MAG TPA: type III secretion system ATPase SctN [Pyrinomonadaceae bacterium]|jgi:type III secretion system H+-transporting two-sector ATPase
MSLDLSEYIEALDGLSTVEERGRVTKLVGLLIRASLPGAQVGEICLIRSRRSLRELRAEVVGFDDGKVILMPLGEIQDVGMGAEVIATGASLTVRVGEGLLGRVLDGLGEPADGKGPIKGGHEYPVTSRPPDAMRRQRVDKLFETGIRALDGVLTVGQGQRLGIFAAAGVGKSTLLGMLARNTEADVNVIALVGERGREVRDFIEHDMGAAGMSRSVVVVATSNEPSLVRMKAAYVATTIAEYFRDQGKRVLLLMDSVTRFARALREVGLAAGETPANKGFPPSLFSELPKLLERTGNSDKGSITAFYTVLVEGDDMSEPVADETRSILDGHIILSRAIAASAHYPAIDISHSISRLMPSVATPSHIVAAERLRSVLATYEENKDAISFGLYERGSDPRIENAIMKREEILPFLRQNAREKVSAHETISRLQRIFPA